MGLVERLGSLFRGSDRRAEPQAPAPASAEAIAAELVDHLAIHRPAPWTQITVRCEQRKRGLRVVSYDVITNGACDDEPPRYLLDDNVMRTAFVSVTIERLADALATAATGDATREWRGERLEVRRVGDRYVVNALDSDGHIVAALAAGRAGDRLLPPRLVDDLAGLRDTIEARDDELHRRLADHTAKRWDGQGRPDRIEFTRADGSRFTMAAALLGTHSQDEAAWTWSWADPTVNRPAQARARTLRQRGRSLFARVGFQASEPFAWTVAHLASARLGGATFGWPVENTGETLFFALFDVID